MIFYSISWGCAFWEKKKGKVSKEEDELRPRFYCTSVYEHNHGIYKGFNRAQAAVIEAAILASRLHMLPKSKVSNELKYLSIAIEKTAGERERRAWGWLQEKITNFYTESEAV